MPTNIDGNAANADFDASIVIPENGEPVEITQYWQAAWQQAADRDASLNETRAVVPATSGDNHIPTFDGTDSNQLQDSGASIAGNQLLIGSVMLRNNPTFPVTLINRSDATELYIARLPTARPGARSVMVGENGVGSAVDLSWQASEGGVWTPAYSNLVGLSAVATTSAIYRLENKVGSFSIKGTIDPSGVFDVLSFDCDFPVGATISDLSAMGIGAASGIQFVNVSLSGSVMSIVLTGSGISDAVSIFNISGHFVTE